MDSNQSMSSSLFLSWNGSVTSRLESDSIDSFTNSTQVDHASVIKNGKKKLRRALKEAIKKEKKEARKMKKLTNVIGKGCKKHSKRTSLLYAESISDCSAVSDDMILSKIWASAQLSTDREAINELPQVEDEEGGPPKIKFLFFSGCPDDKNCYESEFRYRRRRSSSRIMRYPLRPSITITIPIKPTLVSKMPRVFTPRFDLVPRR
ncbi:hypothetical protein PsorP6_001815 [Peronosclerospora sorghi]|uniref:Uncharacterized protein n=1 Tax=Peronosclerospora sorghi TaxID=230839 RepID=A0ACC0WXF1_9STRA|nr:hypothetical protein PsorP6_001815 [Peronosclerospora sorghi]